MVKVKAKGSGKGSGISMRYLLASEAAEFYMWRYLEAELKGVSDVPLGKKHAKYLADAMYDYLCIASLGEARHAHSQCYTASVNLPHNVERLVVYRMAHKFNPKQFLPVLDVLFNQHVWKGNFGGKAWGKAVKYCIAYSKGELTPVMFVDNAIWLHHNTGVIFNKPLIFKDGGKQVFKAVLDAKRHSRTPLQFVQHFYMSRNMQAFLEDFFGISCRRNYLSMLDRGYTPVSFTGEKELVLYVGEESKEKGKKEAEVEEKKCRVEQ